MILRRCLSSWIWRMIRMLIRMPTTKPASIMTLQTWLRSPCVCVRPASAIMIWLRPPQLTAKLIAAVQHRFADLSGTTSKNVHVTLAPGSLLIFVTIVVPDNAALQIRSQIIDQVDDGTVGDTLAIDISSIPGISSVSFGPITINTEVIDGHTLDSTAANTTLSTLAKRAPLLTSYLAFELNLFGGNWLLCYTYGGVSGDSSMKVGDLPIFGAGLLRSVGQRPRVGHPFVLEVYAPLGGLLLEDRLMITDAEAPMCGAGASNRKLWRCVGLAKCWLHRKCQYITSMGEPIHQTSWCVHWMLVLEWARWMLNYIAGQWYQLYKWTV